MWLGYAMYGLAFAPWGLIALVGQAIILAIDLRRHRHSADGEAGDPQQGRRVSRRTRRACRGSFRCRRSARDRACGSREFSVLHRFYTGLSEPCCRLAAMIKVHVAADGTKSFQVYGRARVREKSVRVYVGSFASKRDAEAADEAAPRHAARDQGGRPPRRRGPQAHARRRARRVAPRDQGPALARRVRESDAALRAPDVRQHAAREDHEAEADRPAQRRSSEREEPIGNATINTLFASLSAAYSYFIEQGWCTDNPLKFIRDARGRRAPVPLAPVRWRGAEAAERVQRQHPHARGRAGRHRHAPGRSAAPDVDRRRSRSTA